MGLYIDPRWDTFNVLAIDPGKHYLGASIHELETRTGDYRRIDVETIFVDKYFNPRALDDEYVSVTDRCLMKIRHHVMWMVEEYNIDFFAYEAPFYNPARPAAYGSLCEVVSCIRQAALDVRPNILIDSMSPQNIKKGMGAGGTKGKEIMFEKVLATKELVDVLHRDIEDLTEHCIDSLAIGYNARNTILAPMEGWNHGNYKRTYGYKERSV